jgi:hypothetical protein
MSVFPLYAFGMDYGAALVLAAVVIGVTARLALLYGQGKQILRRH